MNKRYAVATVVMLAGLVSAGDARGQLPGLSVPGVPPVIPAPSLPVPSLPVPPIPAPPIPAPPIPAPSLPAPSLPVPPIPAPPIPVPPIPVPIPCCAPVEPGVPSIPGVPSGGPSDPSLPLMTRLGSLIPNLSDIPTPLDVLRFGKELLELPGKLGKTTEQTGNAASEAAASIKRVELMLTTLIESLRLAVTLVVWGLALFIALKIAGAVKAFFSRAKGGRRRAPVVIRRAA